MPTARYGYVSLRRLWIANSGPKKLADVMAAIALAESRGNPNARHVNNDGSIDQGLWQINSSNYSGSDIYNPNVNARWAVRLATQGRGLRNWTTFTSGKYKKFLPRQAKGGTVPKRKGFGVFSQGNYAGTDQGVDFSGSGPIPALASGVVTDVGTSSIVEGGTYPYVIYRLTSGPYKGHYVYVAENFAPTVKVGTKVKVGQEIGKAIGAYPYIEVGFNKTSKGWNPVAPLNPNPHSPKAAGNAMWAYIQGVAQLHPGATVSGVAGKGRQLTKKQAAALWKQIQAQVQRTGNSPTAAAGQILSNAANATGIPAAIETLGTDIMYAGAIAGGGLTFILGVILIAADIGLSTRAGKVAAAVPVGRYITKASAKTSKPESSIPNRREERAEEKHQAQLKNIKARTKATKSGAKHRRKTVKEQKKENQRSYYQGATDAASPTIAKVRRARGKRKST